MNKEDEKDKIANSLKPNPITQLRFPESASIHLNPLEQIHGVDTTQLNLLFQSASTTIQVHDGFFFLLILINFILIHLILFSLLNFFFWGGTISLVDTANIIV